MNYRLLPKFIVLLPFVLLASAAFSGGFFFGATGAATGGGGGGGSSITTSGNWTDLNNRTLTVPGGNPGVIKFTGIVSDATAQYSKNNGAFTTFVNNDTLSVANGDTLKFRENPALSGGIPNELSCTVIDSTTSATVGTVSS